MDFLKHSFVGLHIVGWPLLLGVILDATGQFAKLEEKLLNLPQPGLRRWLGRWATVNVVVLCMSLLAIACYVAVAFARPGFAEWVENGVAYLSRLWAGGGVFYPNPPPTAAYNAFPYGPLLFQGVGAVYMLSGGAEWPVKTLPIIVAVLSYVTVFFSLRRVAPDLRKRALVVAVLAIVVGIMGFMVKADIMLIAIAVIACSLHASARNQIFLGTALAALAGVAVAIKFHGIFYVLPAAVECLALCPSRLPIKLATGAIIAIAVSFAPFLVPRTSVMDYINILRTASHDGVRLGIFISNIAFIGSFVMCVHVLTAPALRDAVYRRKMISLLAAGFFVSIFAAKAEAGPHHLIPLLPYLCAPLGAALASRDGNPAQRLFLLTLFLISFQPITSVVHDIILLQSHWLSRVPLI